MKKLLLILLAISTISCVPTRIAPRFEGYKVMKARKFKRKLPLETSFIFKDTKNEGEIYRYFNTKFQLNDLDVGLNTSFQLDNETYYITYHETDIEDKVLNVLGGVIDVALDKKGVGPVFDGNGYVFRKGHWYILLTVYDDDIKNCLLDTHPKKKKILNYLENLRKEYLTIQDYEALLLTEKS